MHPNQEAALNQADKSQIERSFQRIQTNWMQSQWLSTGNQYASNSADEVKRNYPANLTTKPNDNDLVEYISASSIIHCFDGWSYLGRAIDAELAGDPHAAKHLGYYAELRAAMSLLASHGIGAFNGTHVVVDASGGCTSIKSIPTHEFVWEAMNLWANSPNGIVALQEIIQPGQLHLGEWAKHFAPLNAITVSWLKQWGLDLQQWKSDRGARNIVSYNPTEFSGYPISITDTFNAISDIWKICEPQGSRGFPVIDRYLLRLAIKKMFLLANEPTPWADLSEKFRESVNAMLDNLSPRELSKEHWEIFLTNEDDSDVPQIFIDAGTNSPVDSPNHSKEVLARATLLLRVATGAASNTLSNTVVSAKEDLSFWYSTVRIHRKLWKESNAPDCFSDLWTDISDANSAIKDWKNSTTAPCHFSIWSEKAQETAKLATTERIALWGLLP